MSPPHQARFANKVIKKIQKRISPAVPGTADYHKMAIRKLARQGGLSHTGQEYVRSLVQMGGHIDRIIPMQHLIHLERGGFHLVTDASHEQIEVIAVHPVTKVVCARVRGADGQTKFSTLFPVNDEESVAALTDTSKEFARSGNKILKMTYAGYWIECYLKSELEYSSVFPVYFNAVFDPSQNYVLTSTETAPQVFSPKLTVPAAKILQEAISLIHSREFLANGNYFEIHNPNGSLKSLIIDVAPAFQTDTGIPQGVMFQFVPASAPGVFHEWAARG